MSTCSFKKALSNEFTKTVRAIHFNGTSLEIGTNAQFAERMARVGQFAHIRKLYVFAKWAT